MNDPTGLMHLKWQNEIDHVGQNVTTDGLITGRAWIVWAMNLEQNSESQRKLAKSHNTLHKSVL